MARRKRSPGRSGRARGSTGCVPLAAASRRSAGTRRRRPLPRAGEDAQAADRAGRASGGLEHEGARCSRRSPCDVLSMTRGPHGARPARHVVEIALRVGLLEVQRGRDQAVAAPASRHMKASSAAAAPMVCPRLPLIELTGSRAPGGPSARLSAAVSIRSLSGVAVPCALTKSMSAADTRASASAARMARSRPRPSGSGAAMWKPSLALP